MAGRGKPGEPGEPGQPGTSGTSGTSGAGGAGGAGGRGGRGGDFAHRWRYLLGYIVLVVVSVTASWVFAQHERASLNRHDRISCLQRHVIAKNQTDVLTALIFISQSRKPILPGVPTIDLLRSDLMQLKDALKKGC